jgi:hypothetical protein
MYFLAVVLQFVVRQTQVFEIIRVCSATEEIRLIK